MQQAATVKTITTDLLNQLNRDASTSPRLRANHNIHPQLDDPVQRFFNAMQPGTYVRPHRHTDPVRWEFFLIVSGHVSILLFDDQGRVCARHELQEAGSLRGLEIPPGQWHSLVAMQASILFELKEGPYNPLTDKDFAAWAPDESESSSKAVEAWYRRAATGQRYQA